MRPRSSAGFDLDNGSRVPSRTGTAGASESRASVYLTVEEAAAVLSVKPSTVYEWVRQGRLPCYRLGPRAIRFTRELLDEFAAGCFHPGF